MMDYSFDSRTTCDEIAKVGDWLLESLPKLTHDPARFWDIDNLWVFCIYIDGTRTIERYRAAELMHEHGLDGAVNDLARPLTETAYRLDYLSDDEERLVDYAQWQLLDCYHRILKPTSQFKYTSTEVAGACRGHMEEIKTTLGNRFSNKRPRASWKNLKEFITFLDAVHDRDQLREKLYIALGATLSRGLHNAWLFPASAQHGLESGRMAFVMTMDCIGRICLRKGLLGVGGTHRAKKIVQLCNTGNWVLDGRSRRSD